MGSASRRAVLKGAGGLAMALGTLRLAGERSTLPERLASVPSTAGLPGLGGGHRGRPDIQFDIGAVIGKARTFNDGAGDVLAQLPPVHTVFTTAKLNRTPRPADQRMLREALATIEGAYRFAADGILIFISYGLPYFDRLPAGLVAGHMPRLVTDNTRFALEEAVPSPTDVSPQNPGVTKQTFNIPVHIEQNDILITIRSDNASHIHNVLSWLGGSDSLRGLPIRSPALFEGLATVTSSRAQFTQIGLPAAVASNAGLAYAHEINTNSPMWMGFLDQQVDGSGPASICTFAGNDSARLTSARPGDYFDNGSIQHLSHVIEDLAQFYAGPSGTKQGETYLERVQYMFRSNPPPSAGRGDQFANGGGPAFLDNAFQGTGDAAANAQGASTFNGKKRMGHLCGLQRSSRAADGTAMHIRMDGPGFDSMDVPGGASQPKLQFTIFVPTAEFFRGMRVNQASLDLVGKYGVKPAANGIERFITATRRQNFLAPPRRHRAFPLVELVSR
jgi:hypothetical protein